MDAIANVTTYDDLNSLILPTIEAFVPILNTKQTIRDYISARKTFTYGPTERHQLDVYYPRTVSGPTPVFFFFYGGSFTSGDRTLTPPLLKGLAYGNVGAYFAEKGFVTVIADYRLAPVNKYPGPTQDVKDAIQWVLENTSQVVAGTTVTALNLDKVILLGASAAGAHLAGVLLSPDISGPPLKVAGVATLGGGFAFTKEDTDRRSPAIDTFYGSEAITKAKEPVGLVRSHKDKIKDLPPWLVITAENEPNYLRKGNALFLKLLRENGKLDVNPVVAMGHNHLSVTFALGTGDEKGEKWAEDLFEWTKKL